MALDAWYFSYVCFAKEEGIIGGHPNGTFQPNNNISVAEALKIVSEAFFEGEAFSEEGLGEWYEKYVEFAKGSGFYLSGNWNGPAESLTRGEMAEVIYRVRE